MLIFGKLQKSAWLFILFHSIFPFLGFCFLGCWGVLGFSLFHFDVLLQKTWALPLLKIGIYFP